MREIISDYLEAIGIAVLIVLGWQGLELIMVGKITPNKVDTVVAIILTFSLHGNFKSWRKLKK